MADEIRPPRRGPMGRGMNQGPGEKAKDFNSAIKRLTHELKSFKYIILSALILAIIGAILSIFAPNRLSELTDEIDIVLEKISIIQAKILGEIIKYKKPQQNEGGR